MFARTTIEGNAKRIAAERCAGFPPVVLAAAAIFVLSMVAPVTIDFDSGIFTLKTAEADHDDGDNDDGDNDDGDNDDGDNDDGDSEDGDSEDGDSEDGDSEDSTVNEQDKSKDVSDTGSDENGRLLPVPTVTVARFTTNISRRYPADEITDLDDPHQSISYFSELQGMSGQTITHLWLYEGEVEFKAAFKIRADRWRIWSTQLLPATMPGEWTVEIVNQEGEVLQASTLAFAPKAPALAEN